MNFSQEMGLPALIGIILLAAVTFFVNFVGIKHYNNCEAMRGVEEFENRKVYLSQLVTIVITAAATLGLRKFISTPGASAAGPMMIIGGVLLLVSGVFVYQLLHADKETCAPKDSEVNYSILGMTFASFIILAGLGATYMAYTEKGAAPTPPSPQPNPISYNMAGNTQ
jgi:hypothetical protein